MESNEVFVLSCDHVMKGAEGDASVPIVQPSLFDTVRNLRNSVWTYIEHSPLEIQEDLKDRMRSLEEYENVDQLTKEEIKSAFAKCCQMTDEHYKSNGTECKCATGRSMCLRCQLGIYKDDFLKIYREQPRKIATYLVGCKGHVNEEEGPFFVDAALAKLEDSEVTQLKNKMKRLYAKKKDEAQKEMGGKEKEKDECNAVRLRYLDGHANLIKHGRTTGTTTGHLESQVHLKNKRYPRVRDGRTTLFFHVDNPDYYCESCAQERHLPSKGDTKESPTTKDCTGCGQTISCYPHYALPHTFCESCPKKRGFVWPDAPKDTSAICDHCQQMKLCCVRPGHQSEVSPNIIILYYHDLAVFQTS